MVKNIMAVILSLLSIEAYAESRQESLNRLTKATGLVEMVEQQKQRTKSESEKQINQMLEQVFEKINPDEKFRKRISVAAEHYMQKLQSPWSAEEITSVWSKYYGDGFTDEELKTLADFYESPLGQKEREANQRALPLFSDHFTKLGEPIFTKANSEFIKEIQLTIKECKCSR